MNDKRTPEGMPSSSGLYKMTKEKKNDRPLFENEKEWYANTGLWLDMWSEDGSWNIGDASKLFEVMTDTAPEESNCPFVGEWTPGLEISCAEKPPTPTKPGPTGTPKPKHECCKRYDVEGDDWEGMYLFKDQLRT